jgi:hypothetical protein
MVNKNTPPKGDTKRLLFSNHSAWKHRPPLCYLDRSPPGFPTSRCWRRPRVRLSVKRAVCRPSKPRVFTGNPGERSGEICGSAVLSWKCFSCRAKRSEYTAATNKDQGVRNLCVTAEPH